jgi:hypothetical protein
VNPTNKRTEKITRLKREREIKTILQGLLQRAQDDEAIRDYIIYNMQLHSLKAFESLDLTEQVQTKQYLTTGIDDA